MDTDRPGRDRHARVFEGGPVASGPVVHLEVGAWRPGQAVAEVSGSVCPRQRPGDPARVLVGIGSGSPIGGGVTISPASSIILDGLGDQDQGGQLGTDVEPAPDRGEDLGGVSPYPGIQI